MLNLVGVNHKSQPEPEVIPPIIIPSSKFDLALLKGAAPSKYTWVVYPFFFDHL